VAEVREIQSELTRPSSSAGRGRRIPESRDVFPGIGELAESPNSGSKTLKQGAKTPDSRFVNGNSSAETVERAVIEAAFRFAAIGKALVTIEGCFVRVNDALCEMLGYSAAELAELRLTEITHPEDVELGRDDLRRVLDGEVSSYQVEKRFLHRSGRVVWGDLHVSVVRSDDGTPTHIVAQIQNVTERKAAEEALAQSEERFRGAFDAAPIGIAITAPDGRFLSVNEALCAMHGRRPDELIEMRWQDLTHPDDVETDESAMRKLIAGEVDSIQLDKRYLHKDGHVVWGHLSVSAVRASDGVPLHFVAQILDITERKRSEEALRQSEDRFRNAFRSAAIGMALCCPSGQYLQVNDAICEIVGYSADQLTGLKWQDITHPEDLDADVELARQMLAGERSHYHMEKRYIHRDGHVVWVLLSVSLVRASDGTPVHFVIQVQDVSELRAAERRYRTLVEQLPMAMYIRPIDSTNPNLYASPQIERLLGYSQEEWLTDAGLLERIVHPDDVGRVVGESEILRETGEPFRGEYRYRARDGSEVWVQDETYLVVDDDGRPEYVQGYLLDITERKQAEEERDRLRDELHHAQKLESIGQLAGALAHDFNNTLTAIRGYGELLEAGLPAEGPFRRYAEEIRKTAEGGAALPRQLLAFARKQPLETTILSLNEIVTDSCRLLGPLLGEQIALTCEPGPPVEVVGDRVQLGQALLNLALNARDAMPDGGELSLATRCEVVRPEIAERHRVDPGDYAVVSVRDSGRGMDAETLQRVFEPFFTTKQEGTGLGLATLYGMVRQSGGFVTVESEPGLGTTFEIYLPCQEERTAAEPRLVAQPQRGIGTVLLAEDEDSVRGLVREVLELAGYEVLDAANGAEALAAMEREGGEIDALVTDLKMPQMDGLELARRVRETRPDLPTIAISAYSDHEPDGDGVTFLAKPFSSVELIGAVDAAIAGGPGVVPREAEEEKPVSVLIADDHPPVLDSVSRVLESKGFRVVGTAADGNTALRRIIDRRPQVALVDIRMGGLNGVEVARRAAALAPNTAVVLYTGQGDGELVRQAMDAGARGYLRKDASLNDIARVLREVAGGALHVDPEVAEALVDPDVVANLPSLTERERQVLRLLAEGKTNEGAASHLSISAETVQTHVRKAMSKLHADTRTAAVATALRLSLIP
jgi:two-component system, cell cycle sensor histidine kinase and response regulator CckA